MVVSLANRLIRHDGRTGTQLLWSPPAAIVRTLRDRWVELCHDAAMNDRVAELHAARGDLLTVFERYLGVCRAHLQFPRYGRAVERTRPTVAGVPFRPRRRHGRTRPPPRRHLRHVGDGRRLGREAGRLVPAHGRAVGSGGRAVPSPAGVVRTDRRPLPVVGARRGGLEARADRVGRTARPAGA